MPAWFWFGLGVACGTLLMAVAALVIRYRIARGIGENW